MGLTVVAMALLTSAFACSSHSDAPSPATNDDGGSSTISPAGGTSGVLLNALAPNLPMPTGGCSAENASDPYCAFMQYVAPHVHGVSTFLFWAMIDHGSAPCSEGSPTSPCDWTAYDQYLQNFVDAGLSIGLIVIGVPEGGKSNQGTPAYVFTPEYAASLGAPPQDMAVCGTWPGAAASPVQGSQTVSGIWNHDACVANGGSCSGSAPFTDHDGFPVVYEKPYRTAYQGFIANVLKHFSPQGTGKGPALASHLDYARIGMTAGGETQLFCSQNWPGPAGLAAAPNAYTRDAFVGSKDDPQSGYISQMASFIASQKSALPTLFNAHVGPPADTDVSYADDEADIAAANGMGFGMESLSIGDAYESSIGKPCGDDWCANFTKYSAPNIPRVLQTTVPMIQPTASITSISGDGANATVTCSSECNLYTGNSGYVQISGNSIDAFNGTFRIVDAGSDKTTFTFASNATGAGTGGSLQNPDYLPTTVPFAVSKHATALEIYLCDLFYAFDPNSVDSQACSTPPGAESAAYASALGTLASH